MSLSLAQRVAPGVIFICGYRKWDQSHIQKRMKVKEKKPQCAQRGPIRGQMASLQAEQKGARLRKLARAVEHPGLAAVGADFTSGWIDVFCRAESH